jgi:shikimate dehydrogenase
MRLVVLGDPVDHSRSPAIQTAALEACGIEGTYTARRVDEVGMSRAVDEVRYSRLSGANVTMPHKRLAFELADRVTETALRSGAVNTLVRRDGEVWGHNTDVDGMRAVWASVPLPPDRPVLILGAGGAAAGAVVAVAGWPIVVSARRDQAATDLVERTRSDGSIVPWGTPLGGAVVVNATPIGMGAEPLPHAVLEVASGFFDLTYGPVESPSVRYARELGIPTADGKELLLAQAATSFEIWTGVPAPIDVMRSAF